MWHDKPYLFEGGLAVDDRGTVSFVNAFEFKDVKRFYMVENHEKGFIRAWHGHKKEGKYIYVVNGSALIGAVPLDADTYPSQDCAVEGMEKFVLSARKPQVLYIPPGYYNGFMTLEESTKVMFFSTSTLDDSLGDDIRRGAFTWNLWTRNYR